MLNYLPLLTISLLLVLVSCNEVSQPCLNQYSQEPLLLVSRLDGVISAIELTDSLPVIWELDLGYPLLSTSATVAYKDNTMLIPSLDGNLYSLSSDGDQQTIHPYSKLEALLNKPSEPGAQSRWVGGKVITTRGVTPVDGRVLYQCNIDNCKRFNDSTVGSEPLLAVTDERKTVRLLDMKLGVESWNWSIASVEMQYVGVKHRSSCLPPHLPVNLNFDIELGVITAQFQTGHFVTTTIGGPLSQAWVLNDEYLQSVNMFFTDSEDPNAINIYLGQWGSTLYIQPFIPYQSLFGIGRINEEIFQVGHPLRGRLGRDTISWERTHKEGTTALATVTSTSLIPLDVVRTVWKPRYDYIPPVLDAPPNPYSHTTPANDMWVNLETILSIISTALGAVLCGYVIYRLFYKKKPKLTSTSTETEVETSQSPPSSPLFSSANGFSFDGIQPRPFESRLEQDFEVIRELGQGGFGKVIEAQHRISKHNYAIKIIKLPNKEELKKKVEREVAAMAKLEHPNILRYYTSWKETPTAEWARSRKYTHTSNSESFDSGTSTKSTSPADLLSHNLTSDDYSKTTSYNIQIENENTCSDIVFQENTFSDIVFQDNTANDKAVQQHEASDSIVFRQSDSSEDDSLNAFADVTRDRVHSKSKKPNLLLPLHRKTVDVTDSNERSKPSQSVRIPVSPSSKSVTFSSWEDSTELTRDSVTGDSRSRQSSGQDSFLYIQMQLCSDQTLKEWLINNTQRTGIMKIFSEIIDAVEYIHSNNHIHRDLKPSNILFSEDGKVKVADFGLATVKCNVIPGSSNMPTECEGPSLTQNLGTKLYMSPELEFNSHYDYKVDIFALGIVFFELLMVFSTNMERVELIQELRNKQTIPTFIDKNYPKYKVILLQMIATNPDDRPTAFEVQTFFSNTDCDQIDFTRGENI